MDQSDSLVRRPDCSPRSQMNSGACGAGAGHGTAIRRVCAPFDPGIGAGIAVTGSPFCGSQPGLFDYSQIPALQDPHVTVRTERFIRQRELLERGKPHHASENESVRRAPRIHRHGGRQFAAGIAHHAGIER